MWGVPRTTPLRHASTRRRLRALLGALAAAALLTSACSSAGAGSDGALEEAPSRGSASASVPGSEQAPTAVPRDDRDEPTGWGPTRGEVARAGAMVADWDAPRLAGQVIVGRYEGTDAQAAGDLVRDLHLAGVCVTAENVVDATQVRETTDAVAAAAGADGRGFPPVLGVDQEGGTVSHLRGIATEFPSFSSAGRALQEEGPEGRAAVREAARTTGLELRDLGFTWVYAPVADVTIGSADPTIGSRSPSTDPGVAARAVASAVAGYNRAGIVSTTKHFPGHGAVTQDSHLTLPRLDTDLSGLRERELPPFEAAVERGAPSVMVGHLDVPGLSDAGVPTSLAPETYAFLRDDLGFDGVAITDSLGMGAVSVDPRPALSALNAGADLLLMPAQTRATHRIVTGAIEDERIPRERIEEAAARVVALQLWQQRVAAERAVPEDVGSLADDAARALESAAY